LVVLLVLVLLLLLVVLAVVLRLLVGDRLLLLVMACAWLHLGVLVFLVLLQRVQLLMLLHVLVLVGDRIAVSTREQRVVDGVRMDAARGDVVDAAAGNAAAASSGVLHVGSLRLLVMFCGWLLQHLLVDIKTLLVGRLVTLLLVL
jgi:hypothetical protein